MKIKKLKQVLSELESVLVAYSGGVDSTLLLRMAKEVLGDRVLAVTALSPTYPEEEVKAAAQTARRLGVKHLLIKTDELSNKNFVSNPPERCYYCKRELFSKLKDLALEHNLKYVLDGTNFDDLSDHRPGMKAAGEFGIRSPLKEAGLTKRGIRKISKKLGLPTFDKPSLACLASRFPYGTKITKEVLRQVEKAEGFLRRLGFKVVRVRHYGDLARIEVAKEEIAALAELKDQITKKLMALGYSYITLDLEGYRTGSMNEVLKNV